MSKTRKLLATAVIVGLVGTIGGWATYSAFSATTTSAGNRFAAGTVAIDSNSSGSAMYQVAGAKPGDSVTKCTKVTYTGSLASAVRLYTSAVGPVASHINLTIKTGSGNTAFPDCVGFTEDAGAPFYTGTLADFATNHGTADNGRVDAGPGSATSWAQNDSVVYQFVLTLADDNGANGGATALSTGDHTFTWEARNV